jgi:hypothetical protein
MKNAYGAHDRIRSVILSGTSRREERGRVEGPRCDVLYNAASGSSYQDAIANLFLRICIGRLSSEFPQCLFVIAVRQ